MTAVLFFKTLAILVAAINPWLYIPAFLELTKGKSASERRSIALRTIGWCVALAVLVIAVGPGAVSGPAILIPLGLEINDATIAAGIILLIAALPMLLGKPLTLQEGSEQERASYAALDKISFYPMAFPVIMGPAAMAGLCLMNMQAHVITDTVSTGGLFAFLAAAVVALVIAGVGLCLATGIGARMSTGQRAIMTRLSGMLLLGFAVDALAPLL